MIGSRRPRARRHAIGRYESPHSAFEEKGMPGTQKFMADLLAIIASNQRSENEQIDAATKLAMEYTADLKDSLDKWVGSRAATRASSACTRPSSRSRVDTLRSPRPGACCMRPKT